MRARGQLGHNAAVELVHVLGGDAVRAQARAVLEHRDRGVVARGLDAEHQARGIVAHPPRTSSSQAM